MFIFHEAVYYFLYEAVSTTTEIIINCVSNIDFKQIYIKTYTKAIEFKNSFNTNTIVINTLFSFSIFYTKIQEYCNKVPLLNIVIESICYGSNFIYSFIINKRIEPYNKKWLSISKLIRSFSTKNPHLNNENNENNNFKFIFDYKLSESFQYKFSTIESFEMIYKAYNQSDFMCPMDVETLLILKSGDIFLVRVFTKSLFNITKKRLFISNIPSKVKFLNIEYTHPNMKNSITLNLGQEYFIEGNELLSSAFVKRMLEYQNKPYFFDFNYKLKIVDNHINFFEIESKDYLLLEKENYKIMN
jgi:hypothetical protein